MLLSGNVKLPANPALAYLDGLRRPGGKAVRAVPESPAGWVGAAPSPAPMSPAPPREVRKGFLPRDSDQAGAAQPGEVWRRVTLAPGLEVHVSGAFRVPRGEARWDELLRRLREALDTTPRQ